MTVKIFPKLLPDILLIPLGCCPVYDVLMVINLVSGQQEHPAAPMFEFKPDERDLRKPLLERRPAVAHFDDKYSVYSEET